MERYARNAEIIRRIEAGETTGQVARKLGMSTNQVYELYRKVRGVIGEQESPRGCLSAEEVGAILNYATKHVTRLMSRFNCQRIRRGGCVWYRREDVERVAAAYERECMFCDRIIRGLRRVVCDSKRCKRAYHTNHQRERRANLRQEMANA